MAKYFFANPQKEERIRRTLANPGKYNPEGVESKCLVKVKAENPKLEGEELVQAAYVCLGGKLQNEEEKQAEVTRVEKAKKKKE